jgi:hypothetical protein
MAAKCVDAAFKLQGKTAAVISSKDLMEWCKTEMMNKPTLDAMVDTLSTALRTVGLTNVAQMLNGYASTKCLNV